MVSVRRELGEELVERIRELPVYAAKEFKLSIQRLGSNVDEDELMQMLFDMERAVEDLPVTDANELIMVACNFREMGNEKAYQDLLSKVSRVSQFLFREVCREF